MVSTAIGAKVMPIGTRSAPLEQKAMSVLYLSDIRPY